MLAVLAASLAIGLGAAGNAYAVTLCGTAGGSICCGSQVRLNLRWIYLSSWAVPATGSKWEYWARRLNSSDSITYNSRRANGGNWTFDNNGYHGWRATAIYRQKSALMNFSISQATKETCTGP
jgi:hypothetical protein